MPKPQFTLHIPEDYDGNKHRSIDQYHGRDELQWQGARRHEGIIIVRFELMFKVRCGGCEEYVSMGNRYDAEKRLIGKYHSTNIYKFTMNCHICLFKWEIRTDPETLDYVCMSGCTRKEENWDTRENNGLTTIDSEVKKKILGDKMFNKEYKADDKRRAVLRADELRLEQLGREKRKFDYDLNAQLRRKAKLRREKEQKEEAEKMEYSKKLANPDLVVLSSDEEDKANAKEFFEKSQKRKSLNMDQKIEKCKVGASKLSHSLDGDSGVSGQSKIGLIKSKNAEDGVDSDYSNEDMPTIIDLTQRTKSTLKNKQSKKEKLEADGTAEQYRMAQHKKTTHKEAKSILRKNLGTDLTKNILGKGRSSDVALQFGSFKNFKKDSGSSSSKLGNQKSNSLSILSKTLKMQPSKAKNKVASMVRLKR